MEKQAIDRELKSKIVLKTTRNVQRGYQKEEGATFYRPDVRLCLERPRLMTESYKMTEGQPMVIRRAKAIEHILLNMTIYIQDWERIVGNYTAKPNGLMFPIEVYWDWVDKVVNNGGRSLVDDDGRAEIKTLIKYWRGKSMRDIEKRALSPEMEKYWRYEGTFIWSQWYDQGIPNYEKLFSVGLSGIIKKAQAKLDEVEKVVPSDYVDQRDFLTAVIIVLKATIEFGKRYADKARELARTETRRERKEELDEISRICEWVPANPPRTFKEALQFFWFIHMIRGQIEFFTGGLGVRFDLLMYPFYEKDKREGRITREEAQELLQLLWLKFEEWGMLHPPLLTAIYAGGQQYQTLNIGGVTADGQDATNEMSYIILDASYAMRTLQPSLAVRYHKKIQKDFIFKAIDLIATGIGYPAFFNDDALIPLMLRWGVPINDARNYVIEYCVGHTIPGKNLVRRAACFLLLPKCLWWALHQGINPKTGEQRGAPTPDPGTFASIEDVIQAYLEQVRFFSHKAIELEQVSRSLYEKYLPRPFLSALLDGCIERGQDCHKWTYSYGGRNFIIAVGPTNVADSLAAIKKLVFDEKRMSIKELVNVLDRNWEGAEELRQMILNKVPKYGNGDDYVDMLAKEVHHQTTRVVEEFIDNWGMSWSLEGSNASVTYGLSLDTPATPDGRKDGDPLADGTSSPAPGRDTKGPTAVLQSCSRIDPVQTYSQLLNQRFMPHFLEGENREIFYGYLKSWADFGISHIQFNVVDTAALRDAQEHPERYKDLIVRVAGYSAYFLDLSKGLQDHIIARSEQEFA